ncbi:hypothetical protein EES39_19775 [Streptomyces sp. ADI92-24]|nr:hypothetical protein EES39_19775 [Streptomyces sp. ADI92-24]
MALDGVDVGGGEAGDAQRTSDDALLGRAVRCREAVGGAVGVDGGAPDDAEHAVAVAFGVGEPLQQEHADALAPAGAVGAAAERLAPSVGGQAALPAHVDEGVGGGHDGDAAREGERAVAPAQGLGRPVQGDQGGRAGGVDGDGGAFDAERVGDPAGHHAGEAAVAVVPRHVLGQRAEPQPPVVVHHTGEHTGVAAAQGVRVDARALDGLPGDLQQQPLLGVHGLGLAGADAEELGVEVGGLVEESALVGEALARRAGLRVVDVGSPAAVGGERRDDIASLLDELPQLLGRGHAAGVAAGHGDDGDGVVVGDGGGGRNGPSGPLFRVAAEPGGQVVGEGGGRGVVEDERGRQRQAGGGAEPVAEFDGREGVEAHLVERSCGDDAFGPVVAEDGGHLGTDQVEEGLAALRAGQPAQAACEGLFDADPAAPHGAARRTDQGPQEGRGLVGAGVERAQVQPYGNDGRVGLGGDRAVQEGEILRDGQGLEAEALDAPQRGLVEGAAHTAGAGPQPPGERGRGEAEGGAVGGQGVEEDVGGGVVALPRTVQEGGGGGEQDERRQVAVTGELVEVPGSVGLGPQDGVQAGVVEGVDEGVVEHPGRVHHRAQRQPLRYGGQDLGQCVAVGGVAGGDRDLGAECGQLGPQLLGAGGVRAPAAGEQQSAYAVRGDQVPGERGADAAGPAGDQYGAVGAPGGGVGVRCLGGAGQPGGVQPAVAQGDFGFVGIGGEAQQFVGAEGAVGVEEEEAAGVFGLGRAHQSPDGCLGEYGLFAGGGGDRAPGEYGQPPGGGAFVGEPVPYGRECGAQDGADIGGDVGSGEGGAGVDGVGVRVRRGGGGGRQRGPPDVVERVGVRRGGQSAGGEGADQEGVDGGHRGAGGVGQFEGDLVGAGGGDAYPQRGGARRVEGDPGPGEGQQDAAVLAVGVGRRGEVGGVQDRVEQCGVESVGGGRVAGRRGQPYLGEHLALAGLPDRLQAVEGGAVSVALRGQVCVEAGDVEGFGAGWRPGTRGEVRGLPTGRVPGGQAAGGVPGPGGVGGGVLVARVEGDGAPAGGIGGVDDDLEGDAARAGQDQRGRHDQFVEAFAAGLFAGPDREVDERGAGQQDMAVDHVVGEPGVRAQRDPPGEDGASGVREAHHRAQQGVPGGDLAERGRVLGGVGGAEPEPFALEGVGGQFDAVGAGAGEEGVPVDAGAACMGDGQGAEQLVRLVVSAPQERGEHRCRVGAGAAHGAEHRVGSQFEEGGDAPVREGGDGVVEAHGRADVPYPVLGVGEFPGGGEPAGEGGDDGELGCGVAEDPGDLPEVVEHGCHERRVERVADPEPLGAVPVGLQPGGYGGDRLLVPGQDDGAGAVDGGDAHRVAAVREERLHRLLGGLHGDHGAALGQCLHQPAACRDEGGGVVEREDTGDVGGGQLADGVPGHVVGVDAPGLQEPEQGDLDGEEGRLRVHGAVQQGRFGGVLVGEQDVPQGAVELEVEVADGVVEGLGVGRVGLVQPASHGEALAALAGEEERGAATGDRGEHAGGVAALRHGAQSVEEARAVAGEHHGAVGQRGAGGRQRVGEVERAGVGGVLDVCQQASGLVAQGGLGPGGERRRQGPSVVGRGAVALGGGAPRGLGRGLLDDDVGVGAADAEGGDGGPAGALAGRPRHGFGQQPDLPRRPVDVG